MHEDDSSVCIRQTKLKAGMFIWIKEPNDDSTWGRYRIHSLAKKGWANLLRTGEQEPKHSRQLLPKGRWFVCASQEPIEGTRDDNELNQIEYGLFQRAIGKGHSDQTPLNGDNEEMNTINLFGTNEVPRERTKPTLLNDFDDNEQNELLLRRPNDRDNDETFQFGADSQSNQPKSGFSRTLHEYSGLNVLKDTYKLTDILRDLRENQENIEQIGSGMSIIKKYICLIVETNRLYRESVTITPEILQNIERQERDLHNEMTIIVQQIRDFNICDENTEAVCQSLQLGSRLYNEERFLVAKHHQEGQHGLNYFPNVQQKGTNMDINNPEDFNLSNQLWRKLQEQIGGRYQDRTHSESSETEDESLSAKETNEFELHTGQKNETKCSEQNRALPRDRVAWTQPKNKLRVEPMRTKEHTDKVQEINDMLRRRAAGRGAASAGPQRKADRKPTIQNEVHDRERVVSNNRQESPWTMGTEGTSGTIPPTLIESEIHRLMKDLELEKKSQERMRVDLQRRNQEIERERNMILDRTRKEAEQAAKALDRALKGISERDIQIQTLMEGLTERASPRADNVVKGSRAKEYINQPRRGMTAARDQTSNPGRHTEAHHTKFKGNNRGQRQTERSNSPFVQNAQNETSAPLSYEQLRRQVRFERDALGNHNIDPLTGQDEYPPTDTRHNPVSDSETDEEEEDDHTYLSLGAKKKVNLRTESQLVRLEAKSKELRAKIDFCYNSFIIHEQTLATYIDSEIFDTYKMNSVMLKQAEKLQEIHHATDESYIRTIKYLTPERKEQMKDLFQDGHRAYNDILETIKNVKIEMRSRSLVTHNMPSHIAKNIIMPFYDGENLPHIHYFKKEISLLLEKQNIAKSSRGFFIRGQIKGPAATVLTTELKNHSDPSDDVIYQILETHFGEDHYITGLLTKEHAKIGKIPGDDKDWSRVYKATTKHVALIRQMDALKEARTGIENPVDGQYITGLFYYLGQGRQSVLISQQKYFSLSNKDKYELLKKTFTELELNSSKAQVSNSNIQRAETGGGGFAGITEDFKTTRVQDELAKAIEQIKQAGRPQYQGPSQVVMPPINPIMNTPPPNMANRPPPTGPQTSSNRSITPTQVRCWKCDYLGHIALHCKTDISQYHCNRCGVKGNHITPRCPGVNHTPQLSQFTGATNPNNIRLPTINQLNQPQRTQRTRFAGAPGTSPRMSCTICEAKAKLDNITVQLIEHPKLATGKPLREACPTIAGLPDMKSRVELLNKLNICLACIKSRLSEQDHNGNTCDLPFPGLRCSVPGCKIRYTLCLEHKADNEGQLDYIAQLYKKMGVNMSFMHTIETAIEIESVDPNILLSNDRDLENTDYGEIECLLESISDGVIPMNDGSPHFILYRMQGLEGQPVLIAYDTCAAFSIFRRDILGKSIAAVEMDTSSEHYVKGIGGRKRSKLFCALIPLEGQTKHQMISCHSVEEITEIRTQDISQVIDFITMDGSAEQLKTEPAINESLLGEIRGCFNFADLGEFITVDGLIGINDYALAPKLVLETSIGVSFYRPPIKAFANGPKICIGGSIPDKLETPEETAREGLNCALQTSQFNGSIQYDVFGNTNLKWKELDDQMETAINNLRDSQFIGKGVGMRGIEGLKERDDYLSMITPHLDNDETQIYLSDVEDFVDREDYIRKSLQLSDKEGRTKYGISEKRKSELSYPDTEHPRLTATDDDYAHLFVNGEDDIELSAQQQEKSTIKKDFYKVFLDKDLLDFRCRKCQNCRTCKGSEKRANISLKGEVENAILEQSVTIDIESSKLVACLPLPSNYEELLGDNRQYCERRLRASLKRLMRLGDEERDQLKHSVQKLLDRGFICNTKDLSKSEIAILGNAKSQYHIPTGIVFKPSSVSTPARLVLDASAKTSTGYSLNCLLPKGDINLNMTKLVQVWHLMKYGVCGDLSSFYNRIYLTPELWHVQRFLWIPDLNPDGKVETFVIRTLIYGVKSSGTQCEYAIKKICQIHPRLRSAMGIGNSKGGRYVDDLANSYQDREEMESETKYTIETLEKYGLYLKSHSFAVSGKEPAKEISKDGTVGIGSYIWYPESDHFSCNAPILFIGNKVRGSYTNLKVFEGTTEQELYNFFPKDFTLRETLSRVASHYDAGIGILTPLIAELRGYVRESMLANRTSNGETNWEASISETTLKQICKVMIEIIKASKFKFPRCQIRGELRQGKGTLLTFVDSGDFETIVIYISFETQYGNSCSLVTAKSYLKKGEITVPKSELSACALGAQVTAQVRENLDEYISDVYLFSDSSISIGWIGNHTGVLLPFHRNRVAAVLDVFDKENVYHVVTSENPADLISRKGIKAEVLGPEGSFYNGRPWILEGMTGAEAQGIIKGIEGFSRGRVEDNLQFKEGLKIKMFEDKNIDILRKIRDPEGNCHEHLPLVEQLGHGGHRLSADEVKGGMLIEDETITTTMDNYNEVDEGVKGSNVDWTNEKGNPTEKGGQWNDKKLSLTDQPKEVNMNTENSDQEPSNINKKQHLCEEPVDHKKDKMVETTDNVLKAGSEPAYDCNKEENAMLALEYRPVEAEGSKIAKGWDQTTPLKGNEELNKTQKRKPEQASEVEGNLSTEELDKGRTGLLSKDKIKMDKNTVLSKIVLSGQETPGNLINPQEKGEIPECLAIERTNMETTVETCLDVEKRDNASLQKIVENAFPEQSVAIDIEPSDNRQDCEQGLRASLKSLMSLGDMEKDQLKHSVQAMVEEYLDANPNLKTEKGKLEEQKTDLLWLRQKLSRPKEASERKEDEKYYIEIRVKESSTQIEAIQQLVMNAFPQYINVKRKVKYPHITIIHFTLTKEQSIEDIIGVVSREIIWPPSFWMKLSILEQFSDGAINLTLDQPHEVESIHLDLKRLLLNANVQVNMIERNFRPHLSIFRQKEDDVGAKCTPGFRELIANDELIIKQRVNSIRLMRQSDHELQCTWELTSKEDNLMCMHYDCLMLTNTVGRVRPKDVNRAISKHNQNVGLITLRSTTKIELNKRNSEGKEGQSIEAEDSNWLNEEDEDAGLKGDETPINKKGCGPDGIYTIGSDSDQSEDESTPAIKLSTPNHKKQPEIEGNEGTTLADTEDIMDIDFSKTMIGFDREGHDEDRDTGKLTDYDPSRPKVSLGKEPKGKEPVHPLEEPKVAIDSWGKETIRQIENTKLLYNPLKYTFRKGVRIGSIIVAFLHKLLKRFPEKQGRLLANIKFTTRETLISTIVIDEEWEEEKGSDSDEQRRTERNIKPLQIQARDGEVESSKKETRRWTNTEGKNGDYGKKLGGSSTENMANKMLNTMVNTSGEKIKLVENPKKEEPEMEDADITELVLLARRGRKMLEVDIEGNSILHNEGKTNPLNFESLNTKVGNKNWEKYPGLKNITTVMGNLARKIVALNKSKETLSEHMCRKILHKVTHWRRYGESLCQTAGRDRVQVKTMGRMILKDYNKLFNFVKENPAIMTKIKEVADRFKFEWENISSREISRGTGLLRKVPDTASYWTVMGSTLWSKTCMLVVMGCMTKQTQNYMKQNWSKKKIHQHVHESDGVMISNLRWAETAGPRERFQGGRNSERRFKNGTLGRVPIVDKMSPWFICMALHVHYCYRILARDVKGIDVRHHGVTQNNLDMLQIIYAPGGLEVFKKIRGGCFNCKKRLKRTISNAHGSIHHTQLATSSPFSRSHIDVGGPFFVKGNIAERTGTRANPTRIKTYVLVIVCGFSKATSLEISESCEVSALADALTRHMCKFGPIDFVVSDRSKSQMKLLAEANWKEQVKGEIFTRLGFSYELVPVSCHSYNGSVENKIKHMKLLLGNCNFQSSSITITQFNTLLQLAANIMNSTPLACSKKSTADPGLQVICPAHFLIPKRNLYRLMISPINISQTSQEYFYEMERVFEELLSYFEETVIPATLQKPHHYKKNTFEDIELGDLVLFKKRPANKFSRDWSLGRITEVFLDRDNTKKSVNVTYCDLDGKDIEDNNDEGIPSKSVKVWNKNYKLIQHETHRQTSELIKIYPLEDDRFYQHIQEAQKLTPGLQSMGTRDPKVNKTEEIGLASGEHKGTNNEGTETINCQENKTKEATGDPPRDITITRKSDLKQPVETPTIRSHD